MNNLTSISLLLSIEEIDHFILEEPIYHVVVMNKLSEPKRNNVE